MAAAGKKGHAGRTTYGPSGVCFRSSAEAKYAELFDFLDWKWEYEPVTMKGYIPDFLVKLGDNTFPFEIKGGDSTTYKLKKDAGKGLRSGLDCSYFMLPQGFGCIDKKEDCFALYYEYDPTIDDFKPYAQSCYVVKCPNCSDWSLCARSNNCLKCGTKITDFNCSLIHKIWILINNNYQWMPGSEESRYQRNLIKHCKLILQFITLEIVYAKDKEIDGDELFRIFKKETGESITRENFDNYFLVLTDNLDIIRDKETQIIKRWKGCELIK